MIPLTNNSSATTQKLQAFLSGAAATTNPTVTVSYYDIIRQEKTDNSDYPLANQFTVLDGTTEKDICSAPNTGVTRHIKNIEIYNADTASVTVTVCIDENGTNRIRRKHTLGVASTLHYESGRGWYVVDANGAIVTSTDPIYQNWTPSLGGTATYTTQVGRSVKIGRQVTLWGKLIVNTIGTGSTTTISGAPYTSIDNNSAAQAGSVGYFASLAANVLHIGCAINNNATTIIFYNLNAAGATASTGTAIFGNGAEINFTITYEAAS